MIHSRKPKSWSSKRSSPDDSKEKGIGGGVPRDDNGNDCRAPASASGSVPASASAGERNGAFVMDGDRAWESQTQGQKTRKKVPLFRIIVRVGILVCGVSVFALLHWIHPFDEEREPSPQNSRHTHDGAAALEYSSASTKSSSIRFVTIVMPSVVNPKRRPNRLNAIAETWGPAAHAIFVVHDPDTEYPLGKPIMTTKKTRDAAEKAGYAPTTEDNDESHSSRLGMTNQYPKRLIVPPGINVDAGVPRLQFVLQSLWEEQKKAQEPGERNPPLIDFFFFVNDHTYVIPEHLCRFLRDYSPSQPLYAGHALREHESYFMSGASGYIISRSTLQALVEHWDSDCLQRNAGTKGGPKALSAWLQGNPGLVSSHCLIEKLAVPAIDTRDSTSPQAVRSHRFHAYGIIRCIDAEFDEWYINKHNGMDTLRGVVPAHAFDASYANSSQLIGTDCCSQDTVSFHYVETAETRALYEVREFILHFQREQQQRQSLIGNEGNGKIDDDAPLSDQKLQEFVRSKWPSDQKQAGFYSRPLPPETKVDKWNTLLKVLRKISRLERQAQC